MTQLKVKNTLFIWARSKYLVLYHRVEGYLGVCFGFQFFVHILFGGFPRVSDVMFYFLRIFNNTILLQYLKIVLTTVAAVHMCKIKEEFDNIFGVFFRFAVGNRKAPSDIFFSVFNQTLTPRIVRQ
jgi:hypothetical protein